MHRNTCKRHFYLEIYTPKCTLNMCVCVITIEEFNDVIPRPIISTCLGERKTRVYTISACTWTRVAVTPEG